MTTVTISLPKPHPGQRDAIQAIRGARFSVLCAGRRWGKDVLLTRAAVKTATRSSVPVAWFAPTYRVMRENWRTVHNTLSPLIASASRSEWRMELVNGSVLEFWSLDNYDAARGRSYALVIVNEAAAYGDLLDAWHYVIMPTLADVQGSAVFASTPRGLNGFHTLWQVAESTDGWARYHATTYDNPHIPSAEIDRLRDTMTERAFRQEIMAEFLADGAFFRNAPAVCTVQARGNPVEHSGHRIVAGLDWGQTDDYTALTVFCADCGRVVDWWHGNRMDYATQRAAVLDVLRRWGNAPVLPERNSIGQPNIEEMQRAGAVVLTGPDGRPGFQTTALTKPNLIQRLAIAIERGDFSAPAEYAGELSVYQAETRLDGRQSYSAPSGAHDDRVISLALAWWAATGSGAAFRVGW